LQQLIAPIALYPDALVSQIQGHCEIAEELSTQTEVEVTSVRANQVRKNNRRTFRRQRNNCLLDLQPASLILALNRSSTVSTLSTSSTSSFQLLVVASRKFSELRRCRFGVRLALS
jgi:hypothetical protein